MSPRRRSSRPPPPDPRPGARAVVLLGAQRFTQVLAETVKALEVAGSYALITAGWQEREPEDEELREYLAAVGGKSVNLRLHRRAEQLFAEDRELAKAHRKKQEILRFKQDFYRVRLEHALEAHHVVTSRAAPAEVLAEEGTASIAAIRALDEYHLGQCARVHAEFDEALRPAERRAVKRHHHELAELIGASTALAIAGGHVASLVNRLRLFGVGELIRGQAVFAWSGGAMALSERIVLFHDNTPEGPVAAEVLDRGIGVVPGVVVLPEAEQRLTLGDRGRVGVMAQRFAPAKTLAFPAGAHLTWKDGRVVRPTGVIALGEDGEARPLAEGAP